MKRIDKSFDEERVKTVIVFGLKKTLCTRGLSNDFNSEKEEGVLHVNLNFSQ